MSITPRRSRRGAVRFTDLIFGAGILAGIYTAYLLIPPFMESLEMKEVTSAALYGWSNKHQDRGEEIFRREIEKREMNPDLLDACTWYELRMQNEKYMECYWEVPLYTPWGSLAHTMEFYVHRGIDKSDVVFDADNY